jgi:hypothetical protein
VKWPDHLGPTRRPHDPALPRGDYNPAHALLLCKEHDKATERWAR